MGRSEPRDLFPGALEIMVLRSMLQRESLHGYALVQRIQQASQDLLRVEEGSLYPAWQRLLKAGSCERTRACRRPTAACAPIASRPGAANTWREMSRFEQMLKGVTQVLALRDA
jgi:PadR family transcriptional regulator PadR